MQTHHTRTLFLALALTLGLALRCQGAALFQRFHQTLNNVT